MLKNGKLYTNLFAKIQVGCKAATWCWSRWTSGGLNVVGLFRRGNKASQSLGGFDGQHWIGIDDPK